MEWQLALLTIMSSLILLFVTGAPMAFCFMLVNIIGAAILWGPQTGFTQLILSLDESVTNWELIPLPLFIIMGELMFISGIANQMLQPLDNWIGRIPGRLSLLSVIAGTLLACLTGSGSGATATLGSVLIPEMEKRGYKKDMILGPIMGSGSLAIMIPPSAMAILIGGLGGISIGKILIAMYIPGLLIAAVFTAYIVVRSILQPHLAPIYETPSIPVSKKFLDTARYVLPVGIVIFLVVGVIFVGVATPTEAAATGTLGFFALAAAYRKLNWQVIKKTFTESAEIIGMVFMIIVAAKAFSNIIAFSGGSRGLVQLVLGLHMEPILIMILMQFIIIIMGMFLEEVSILMVALPIYMPLVHALGFDEVWFSILMLINMEIGMISPPFGFCLFAMRAVAPPDTTMGDIYQGAIPFCILDIMCLALVMVFPPIALWLPSMMK